MDTTRLAAGLLQLLGQRPEIFFQINEHYRMFSASTQNIVVRVILVHPAQYGFLTIMPYMNPHTLSYSWRRGTVVERRSLTGELSLSWARPAADG